MTLLLSVVMMTEKLFFICQKVKNGWVNAMQRARASVCEDDCVSGEAVKEQC